MKAREAAFSCLCDVINRRQYASLNMRYRNDELTETDQALMTHIVYGTLRNHDYVRYQWQLYVDRKPNEKISVLLDMSVYQLLLMDRIPAYACINEAVEIARSINESYAPLVNAVLRKVADRGPQKIYENDKLTKLAIETSHPQWLVRMWNAHYGYELTEKMCWENLQEGKVALRVNTMKTSEEKLLEDPRFKEGKIPDCLFYEGNILNTPYFRNNEVIIQSESSQRVVRMLQPQENDRILDMCAAPGTKTIQMAMMMKNTGEIIAVDLYPQRVELINAALNKYGITNVRLVCHDSRNLPTLLSLHSWDKILLDAPCSGLGTLKHKPEIKLTVQPEDLDDIVKLQSELLETAALLIKDGGQIVYSTCTVNKKENEKQIENFLSQHPEFALVNQEMIFPFEEDDGFYIAKLVKSMVK